MRVSARHQRQVNTRHVNKQGGADKEDCYPEAPIPMRAPPVRTMIRVMAFGMRPLIVMCMCATTHWVPCSLQRSMFGKALESTWKQFCPATTSTSGEREAAVLGRVKDRQSFSHELTPSTEAHVRHRSALLFDLLNELCCSFQLAVIVAVLFVRMMQVSLHDIVRMISMRHRLMTTLWTVNVIRFMSATVVLRRTLFWICGIDGQLVFLNVLSVDVMHVPILEIVRMALMFYGGMATVRTVNV